MNSETHAAAGAVVAFPFAFHAAQTVQGPNFIGAGIVTLAALELGGMLAAVLPDVDHPDSAVGRWIYIPFRHRGPTHWLLTAAVVAVLVGVIVFRLVPALAPTVTAVVGLAWASHTLLDRLTGPVELWPRRRR